MKIQHILLAIITLLLIFNSCRLDELPFEYQYSCENPPTYKRTLSDFPDGTPNEIIAVNDSNYVIIGTTNGKAFFINIDNEGNYLSEYTDESQSGISINSAIQTDDQQYMICGSRNNQAYIALHDKDGIYLSSVAEDYSQGKSVCNQIIQIGTDEYAFAGQKVDNIFESNFVEDVLVGRINATNNLTISDKYSDKDRYEQSASVIAYLESENEFLVGGYYQGDKDDPFAPDLDIRKLYFFTLDADLNYIEGEYKPYEEFFTDPVDIIKTPEGDYLVVGISRVNNPADNEPNQAFWITVNSDAEILNTFNRYGLPDENLFIENVTQGNASNVLIVTGQIEVQENIYNSYAARLVGLNQNSNFAEQYRNDNLSLIFNSALPIQEERDCGYMFVGKISDGVEKRVYVVKTDENLNVID